MTCDLCGEKAEYSLCQTHMDEMRFLDTFCTKDGDYPESGIMVLWNDGSTTYIGGYDPVTGWFSEDGSFDGWFDGFCGYVYWCHLPDLTSMYQRANEKGGEG